MVLNEVGRILKLKKTLVILMAISEKFYLVTTNGYKVCFFVTTNSCKIGCLNCL